MKKRYWVIEVYFPVHIPIHDTDWYEIDLPYWYTEEDGKYTSKLDKAKLFPTKTKAYEAINDEGWGFRYASVRDIIKTEF